MKSRRFADSFRYAAQGIRAALREERNLRFHLCAACYVYYFSLFYPFGRTEYLLITLMVCGVLALELMNSAVERAVDKPSPEHDKAAGAAKDMAAGAVLVFSAGCAACGLGLFLDFAVLAKIAAFYGERPLALVPLAASLLLARRFIWKYGGRKNRGKEET